MKSCSVLVALSFVAACKTASQGSQTANATDNMNVLTTCSLLSSKGTMKIVSSGSEVRALFFKNKYDANAYEGLQLKARDNAWATAETLKFYNSGGFDGGAFMNAVGTLSVNRTGKNGVPFITPTVTVAIDRKVYTPWQLYDEGPCTPAWSLVKWPVGNN